MKHFPKSIRPFNVNVRSAESNELIHHRVSGINSDRFRRTIAKQRRDRNLQRATPQPFSFLLVAVGKTMEASEAAVTALP